MTRAVQILQRCIARLEGIMVTDPLRPGTKYIVTRGPGISEGSTGEGEIT